jgi:regulatory protein YycI of two-component signal transduction system YycFG
MMDRHTVFFIFVFLLIALFLPIQLVNAENESEEFRRLKESRINPETGLPITLDPESFTGAVKRGYKIAQENPKILSQLPCSCACESIGHENLLDCFVNDHAST